MKIIFQSLRWWTLTTNVTGVLYTKEGWKEEDSAELLIYEQLDN